MNINFIQNIPNGFNPEGHNLQYWDLAINKTMPENHFHTGNPGFGLSVETGQHKEVIPREVAFQKGLTHIGRLELPYKYLPGGVIDYTQFSQVYELMDAGKAYSGVPQINGIWGRGDYGPTNYVEFCSGYGCSFMNTKWWPTGPLNETESIQAAENTGISQYALHVGETEEGDQYISRDYPMWGWFYKRLKQRMHDKFDPVGKKVWIAHNYFNIGWPSMYYLEFANDKQVLKDAFNKPYAEWPTTSFSPGRSLYDTTLIPVAVYLGAPDKTTNVLADIWQLECIKKMGKDGCIFLFAVHEWRPNNYLNLEYNQGSNQGTVWRQGKIQLDGAEAFNYGFIGHVHGNGTAEWGGQGKVDHFQFDPNENTMPSDLWKPVGSNDVQYNSFPHYAQPGQDRFFGYFAVSDLFNFGMEAWYKTFRLTEGGTRKFLKYRKRRPNEAWSNWITPDQTGMNELVDARFDKRGFILSEVKDSKMAMYWLDGFADGLKYEIEFEHPTNSAITYNAFVSGNMIHTQLINL